MRLLFANVPDCSEELRKDRGGLRGLAALTQNQAATIGLRELFYLRISGCVFELSEMFAPSLPSRRRVLFGQQKLASRSSRRNGYELHWRHSIGTPRIWMDGFQ